MLYLTANGVTFGENGIIHTVARHRNKYYLTMTRKNTKLHEEYAKSLISK